MDTPPKPVAIQTKPQNTDAQRDHEMADHSFLRRIVANRYQILSLLGQGGMGAVWHAYDMKLRVEVALKSLRLDLRTNSEQMEALRKEVRIAREVNSPNVCRIFDLVVDDDQELISMEYIDGVTLLVKLLQQGALEVHEARDIAAQFLAGLDAIHRAGLVHRDVKPENIMITRSGRVVIMDFGIAKQLSETTVVSGTFPYMSPEQISGGPLDAISDVFSAGVVLAEMIHPEGILSHKTREGIWNAVRQDPNQLPDGPWKKVIECAVAMDPEDRYSSAGALSRALEEATQGLEIVDQKRPYPGLSSFTATDAEYFFGRELEVETAMKKLQQLHLMAIVGPSGAGKTSFLRAGLIPALPEGWSSIFCIPGDSPVENLRQSLTSISPKERNPETDSEKPLLMLLREWRSKHTEAVLVIDRFEELFTLNGPETQSNFAEILSKIALEADVRVLLSMRDDFLLRCHDHSALEPIFSELTPFAALTGPALRRALVQPALRCGYRFEDERLVDEILSDLEKERGALPLLAFAASRLWEKRQRTSGLLTRAAYKAIGGVAGALAQHAETTMERIGAERLPIVREIFSNLITAENTRVARDMDELLSVFRDSTEAETVLRQLIDARLLTSFDAKATEGQEKTKIEIIHESLLASWPRLVRWQTQDADSAQLRDQLRQAAQLWEQRSRPEDLLWTGTSYLEFQAWRERYHAGLTPSEADFAHAMIQRATKQRRQRRLFLVATFIVLLGVLTVIIKFWHTATVARDDAVLEAKRAEAGKVLTIGRALTGADPTTKLAYAFASLELADTPQGRRFAMQALFEGSPGFAQELKVRPARTVVFSPDGKWIAAGVQDGVQLFSSDGSAPITVSEPTTTSNWLQWAPEFSPDSKLLIWTWRKDPRQVKIWSIAEKKIVRILHFEGLTRCMVRAGKAFLVTDTSGNLDQPYGFDQSIIRVWDFDAADPERIGKVKIGRVMWRSFDIDSNGRWIAFPKNNGVHVRSIVGAAMGPERLIANVPPKTIQFRPNSNEVVASNNEGQIHFWSVASEIKSVRTIDAKSDHFWFSPDGSHLYTLNHAWNLNAPAEAEPYSFQHVDGGAASLAVDSKKKWMAIIGGATIGLYPLHGEYPYVFRGRSAGICFTPDGKFLATGFTEGGMSTLDGVRLYSMPGQSNLPPRTLWQSKPTHAQGIAIDPKGNYLAAATMMEGVHLISLKDYKDVVLKGIDADKIYYQVAFSPDANSLAAAAGRGIEVWDLKSGRCRLVKGSEDRSFELIRFSSDGFLYAAGAGKVQRWNLSNDSLKEFVTGKAWVSGLAISPDAKTMATSTWNASTIVDISKGDSQLLVFDLTTGKSRRIDSHGNRVFSVTFDLSGTKLITGDFDGIVRVGSVSGETPHLLLGHQSLVRNIAVHPSGKWIVSREDADQLRVWEMPAGKPFDSLPQDEFLRRLSLLTNVRAIADRNTATGYRIQYKTFSGWEKFPD